MAPNKQISLDPYAQQINGPLAHLCTWALEKYQTFGESELRKKKLEHAVECRRVYAQESRILSDPWEGASNIELPLTAITVDNLEPRLVAGLVGSRPYCRLELEGQQEIDDAGMALETWWDNELQDVCKIEDVAADMAHDVLLDGTVFSMPRYSVEETTRRQMRYVDPKELAQAQEAAQRMAQAAQAGQLPPEGVGQLKALMEVIQAAGQNINGIMVDAAGLPVWTDKKVKLFEGGKVEHLKLSDVFMPDDIDDDNYESAPIFRKVQYTYAELMRDSADPAQKGWQKQAITPKLIGEETEDERMAAENLSPAQTVEEVAVSGKKTIECIEGYVSYMHREKDEKEEDAKDFTEERLCVLIATECKLILRLRLLRDINPMNNHVIRRNTIFRERGCSYGTNVYYKMKSVQDGATRSFNLAINTGDIKLLPWGFYTGKSGLDKLRGEKGSIRLGLGLFNRIDDTNGILFPQMNGDPAGFLGFMQAWLGFWEKIFNIGELQIGTGSEQSETATEALAKIQEGNIAHNYRSKRGKSGFLGIIQTLWDLYFAWMPLDKTIKVDGENVPLPRQVMARGFKLRLTASSEMANKLIKRRESEDWAKITGVMGAPGLWNPVVAAEDLAKSYDKDNPSKYVNPGVAQVAAVAMQAPQLVPVMMEAAQQAIMLAQQIEEGGKAKAAAGVSSEMAAHGGNGGESPHTPGPPTVEALMPKFAPQPRDVVKPVGVG